MAADDGSFKLGECRCADCETHRARVVCQGDAMFCRTRERPDVEARRGCMCRTCPIHDDDLTGREYCCLGG